jgi:hypothetical protein
MEDGRVKKVAPIQCLFKPQSPFHLYIHTRLEEWEAAGGDQEPIYDGHDRRVSEEWAELQAQTGQEIPPEWQAKYHEALERYYKHEAAYPDLYAQERERQRMLTKMMAGSRGPRVKKEEG